MSTTDSSPRLIDKVGGEPFVRKAVTTFYERAFSDPIIGHFFFNLNHSELIEKQTSFTRSMLGDLKVYQGKPLVQVHQKFPIRGPHFGRRQVLMRQVLEELELAPQLIEEWLRLEQQLKPLIISKGQLP